MMESTQETTENPFNTSNHVGCSALTAKGTPCTRPVHESGLCKQHAALQTEENTETAPWNASENPWNADKVKTAGRHKGFRPRFVPLYRVDNKKTEGWVIAKASDYNESSPDGTVRRNELILMEIPEGLAIQREKHFSDLTKKRSSGAAEIIADAKLKRETRLTDSSTHT